MALQLSPSQVQRGAARVSTSLVGANCISSHRAGAICLLASDKLIFAIHSDATPVG